jgi:hypothetical protein
VAIAVAISAGCAPAIDGPVERQRAIDRDDGVRTADVVLQRAIRDPLATTPPAPAALRAVITIDDPAAREAICAATERLARAAVPELAAPVIEVHAAAPRATLARVGPFSVEASSRAPLKAVLAGGCLAIAGLASALARGAWRHRRGNSAQ